MMDFKGHASSQLASEYRKMGNWSYFNKESEAFNEKLALNLDYRSLANMIIDVIENYNNNRKERLLFGYKIFVFYKCDYESVYNL